MSKQGQPRSRLAGAARMAGLLLVALLCWSFAGTTADARLQVGLFLAAVAALALALGRRPGLTLVIIGIMTLALGERPPQAGEAWGIVFLASTATGLALVCRNWPGFRWTAASVPFWAVADAPWAMYVALGMTIGGLAIGMVGPTLPGRRIRRGGTPLAHLASGLTVPVAPRSYPGARRSKAIDVLTMAFLCLVAPFGVLAARADDPALWEALAISAAIIGLTFGFSNWFSGRMRLRIDEKGLHSRLFFRESTVLWPDVVDITLRYVLLPGLSTRMVYYVVRSASREFAFPSSMPGAKDLQASIEQVTGLEWPAPEFESTF